MDPLTRIRERARQTRRRIVLPEYTEERMYAAAAYVLKEKIADIVMCGEPDVIRANARKAGLNPSEIEIIDHMKDPRRGEYVAEYLKLRSAKGVTPEQAEKVMSDSLFFGAMLVRKGLAEGSVAGALNSTPNVMRALIQIVRTAPGIKTVSSFFLMVTGNPQFGVDGVLIYADAGVVPDPTPEQLVDIAFASSQNCRMLLEAEPKIAMLSYSSKGSAAGPLVDKVVTATRLLKEAHPELLVDGELQADAALIPEVAKKKVGESPVAGKANILIFPDLNAGNIGYKLTERIGGAQAIGPLVQGTAKPGNDLSRGCSYMDIANVIAVTCLQAGTRG